MANKQPKGAYRVWYSTVILMHYRIQAYCYGLLPAAHFVSKLGFTHCKLRTLSS